MNGDVKRLYRSAHHGRLLGVCAGLGDYFGIDPVVVRLAVVLLTLATGLLPGLVAYLIAWVIVPLEPAE